MTHECATMTGDSPVRPEWAPASLSEMARQLYADASLSIRWMQTYRPYICPFEELMPHVPHGSVVLDVGCGAGLFLGLLQACHLISGGFGLDRSAPAIGAAEAMSARLQSRSSGPALCFEQRDIFDSQGAWRDSTTYDVVCLIDVLHHVPVKQRGDLLAFIASRVKPGGRLIYKDMCRRPRWRAAANSLHDLVLARQWIKYAPVDWVEETVVGLGFRCIFAGTADRLWYGHESRIFEKAADGM